MFLDIHLGNITHPDFISLVLRSTFYALTPYVPNTVIPTKHRHPGARVPSGWAGSKCFTFFCIVFLIYEPPWPHAVMKTILVQKPPRKKSGIVRLYILIIVGTYSIYVIFCLI